MIDRNMNAADKLPSAPIDTTQEISSDDIGPVVSGVSLDFNRGNIGDIQPKKLPAENCNRPTVEEKNRNFNKNLK